MLLSDFSAGEAMSEGFAAGIGWNADGVLRNDGRYFWLFVSECTTNE